MSNKPLKLIPKGRPLEAPEAQTGSREKAVRRLSEERKACDRSWGWVLCWP